MHSVENNAITLTRGDSFYASLHMRIKRGQEQEDYVPQEGDYIRFYLKRNLMSADGSRFIDSKPLISKSIPNETLILHLAPEDTSKLSFGEYVYDIEIEFANGDVDTFINKAPFKLVAEVG